MTDKLSLATFDPLLRDTPELCNLCAGKAPVFTYEFRTEEQGEAKSSKGFCCAACAAALVKKLERVEAREWAEEEEALEVDDVDVSDFKKRRLSAFGAGIRELGRSM
jgi:hypothetical protein